MEKVKKRAKRKRLSPVARLERKKKVFHLFDRLVVGAVKIWLHGSPWIVAVDEVDAFIQDQIENMPLTKD